jgi:hypothetical protein
MPIKFLSTFGNGATGATYSNFFGSNAGQDATGAQILYTGINASGAESSNFFGQMLVI